MWPTASTSEIRLQKTRYGRGGSSGSGFERTKGTRSTRPRRGPGVPPASSTNGHIDIHVVAGAVGKSIPRDVSQMSVRETIKRVRSQGNVPKSGIATSTGTSITCSAMRDEKIDLRSFLVLAVRGPSPSPPCRPT